MSVIKTGIILQSTVTGKWIVTDMIGFRGIDGTVTCHVKIRKMQEDGTLVGPEEFMELGNLLTGVESGMTKVAA